MNINNAMQSAQVALNPNQWATSEGEVDVGQSLFKQLLFSTPSLKAALLKTNQANQGNLGTTVEALDEVIVDEELETAIDGKDSDQVMSSMDINMILNNGNLNKIDLKRIGKTNATLRQSNPPMERTEMVQPSVQKPKSISAGETGATIFQSQEEAVISKTQAETIISKTQAEIITSNGKAAGLEMKQANQGIQIASKASGSFGALLDEGKIHKGVETLTGAKEKLEEKTLSFEKGETISFINKLGNNVIEHSQVDSKNEKLENVHVYNQIAEEIAAKLEQKGPMEFKLQLKPENLGEIDISIKISEGKLSIDIISASSKTQDLLANQVDKLVAKLGLQNFQIETIQVNPGTIASTLSHEAANQAAMLNLGMNFSDRRQQENLKEQSIFKKDLKGISGLALAGIPLENSNEAMRGKEFTQHKINYAI